ncbi:MAG: 16S rRNA (guanine(527)-N(7))-methyltransferase RsmG [Roseovarius sp.]|uniref:16S rRNA (guanine(527)-N(7))-methyltransferase RsmG n=1 Tax=Roseovarius sp. TaxID=1486281 RepID=UPI0032ED13F3
MSVDLDVSRETIERLETYDSLLRKWNPRINLVAKSTLNDLWNRHFVDSAQLYKLVSHPVQHWADIGSGGGFPGLVIAIMAIEHGSPFRVTLVESDARKCAFLRTVARETGARVSVINDRIEDIPRLECDVITARALADLTTLLGYAERNLNEFGRALFLKGVTWKKELSDAQQTWKFDLRTVKSKTEDGPVVLSITGVSRV